MVVLNNTKEANKQKIKEAYDNGKGIWFTITDEIASALIWDYTDRIDGTFEEERMGAGYAYYGTEEEETQSTTGKYAWWDEREMKKEPPDVQEWARQKRIQQTLPTQRTNTTTTSIQLRTILGTLAHLPMVH